MAALLNKLTMRTGVCLLLLTAVCCGQDIMDELQVETLVKPGICYPVSSLGDTMKVHYTGKLKDGKVFDSSLLRDPLVVQLGKKSVIPGLEQSLIGLCEGQKIRITIPTHLGFGAKGFLPTIPGDAALVFEVDVVSLKHQTIWQKIVNNVFPPVCLTLVPSLLGLVGLYLYKKANAQKPARKKLKDKKSKNKAE